MCCVCLDVYLALFVSVLDSNHLPIELPQMMTSNLDLVGSSRSFVTLKKIKPVVPHLFVSLGPLATFQITVTSGSTNEMFSI